MRVARFGSTAVLTIALTFAASSLRAQGAAAICKDGTKSATSGRGACSGHGGVDGAATAAAKNGSKGADKAATKAADKADKDAAGAVAQCKDGTYSHAKSTRGACSRHGGIAKTLKP